MRNKKLNRKGFTLVELLAVIVVLAIILVITVPLILNTIGSTRENALQASANTAADFYRNQLQLKLLNKSNGEANFLDDLAVSGGKITAQTDRCITEAEATTLGLNTTDYEISDTTGTCSTVAWTADFKVTVTLKGTATGEFKGASKSGTK